jgi:hypothetical protein
MSDWIASVQESLLDLSVFAFGEIRRDIGLLPKARRRASLEVWLEETYGHVFSRESWILTTRSKLYVVRGRANFLPSKC